MSSLRTASQETWKWVVSVDEAILLGVRRWESALMTRLMRMLTRMGDPAGWVVAALTLGVVAGAHYALLLGTSAARPPMPVVGRGRQKSRLSTCEQPTASPAPVPSSRA